MEKKSQLFLIMSHDEFRYCLYRVSEDDINEDETSIGEFEPLLKMDKSTFPDFMSFAAIGSRIYMVGGSVREENNVRTVSTTFIYDTLSDTVVPGPNLVSGKWFPTLLTVGTKLFALSRVLKVGGLATDRCIDPKPHFEVLDTSDMERGWRELPVPQLHVSKRSNVRAADVVAQAATYVDGGTAVFISVADMGTYAFDVDEEVWNHVSDEELPFRGHAASMPPSPNLPYANSLCFAYSNKSNKYSVFRFRYCLNKCGQNNLDLEFQVDEVEIDFSPFRASSLPPCLFHVHPIIAFGPGGRVYYVEPGADNPAAADYYIGNCYVKVTALEISARNDGAVKLHSTDGQLLKRCKKKTRRHVGNDEAPNEYVTVERCNKGSSLKRCTNTKAEWENDKEVKDKETMEFKLTSVWRRSFFAGPVCDILRPVSGAIAM